MRLLVVLCAVHATPPADRMLPGQLSAAAETQRLRQLISKEPAPSEQRARAMAAASTLLSHYQKEEDGLFGDTLPWIEANAIETLCDWAIRSGGLHALPPRASLARCSVPHSPLAACSGLPFHSSLPATGMQANITAMLERGVNSTDEEPCHTPYCGSYDDQVRRPELLVLRLGCRDAGAACAPSPAALADVLPVRRRPGGRSRGSRRTSSRRSHCTCARRTPSTSTCATTAGTRRPAAAAAGGAPPRPTRTPSPTRSGSPSPAPSTPPPSSPPPPSSSRHSAAAGPSRACRSRGSPGRGSSDRSCGAGRRGSSSTACPPRSATPATATTPTPTSPGHVRLKSDQRRVRLLMRLAAVDSAQITKV